MDIGVWMAPAVLEHKLEARYERNKEAAWNVRSVPKGLGKPGVHDRLFVASAGVWCGYFTLEKEVLWSPEDKRAPITLLFDARSWTPVPPVAVRRFRGLRPLTEDQLNALQTETNEIPME
jgi:hypothetical protein